MPSWEGDRALVRACLAGDRGAWESLVRKYSRLIYSVPRRCGLGEEDAADVFQTVCLRLLQSLEGFRDQDRLSAWLITTANRESWRVKGQAHRHAAPSPDDEPSAQEALPASDPLPQEVLLRLEDEQLVRQAFEGLGERCRVLLELLYYRDPAPSYLEVGERLGIPQGSIGPTRARCLQQLKKLLEGIGF
jgi:RNA polymerase sigma factor (sigma-70 family)